MNRYNSFDVWDNGDDYNQDALRFDHEEEQASWEASRKQVLFELSDEDYLEGIL